MRDLIARHSLQNDAAIISACGQERSRMCPVYAGSIVGDTAGFKEPLQHRPVEGLATSQLLSTMGQGCPLGLKTRRWPFNVPKHNIRWWGEHANRHALAPLLGSEYEYIDATVILNEFYLCTVCHHDCGVLTALQVDT